MDIQKYGNWGTNGGQLGDKWGTNGGQLGDKWGTNGGQNARSHNFYLFMLPIFLNLRPPFIWATISLLEGEKLARIKWGHYVF